MSEEEIREVELLYIKNTSEDNYTLEACSRGNKITKLNFPHVEGIEMSALRSMEVQNTFLHLGQHQKKMCNMRFVYPINLKVNYLMGNIIIKVL